MSNYKADIMERGMKFARTESKIRNYERDESQFRYQTRDGTWSEWMDLEELREEPLPKTNGGPETTFGDYLEKAAANMRQNRRFSNSLRWPHGRKRHGVK